MPHNNHVEPSASSSHELLNGNHIPSINGTVSDLADNSSSNRSSSHGGTDPSQQQQQCNKLQGRNSIDILDLGANYWAIL